MNDSMNKIIMEAIPDQKGANELLSKLFDITKPEAVFSPPITADNVIVITASEYVAGLGVGYGGGAGGGSSEGVLEIEVEGEPGSGFGVGGGGGGGGMTVSRPVAAIIIESGHVRVEPIVDATKIAIALFTTIGAMAMAFSRMRRRSR